MNRKYRRATKTPYSKPEPSAVASSSKSYQVTFAGSDPNKLSRKERSIVLALASQVPYAALIADQQDSLEKESLEKDNSFELPHMHVMFGANKKVCLRWDESDEGRVVEGTCETL